MRRSSNVFSKRVIQVVSGIKRGETLSYGEVARRAGNSKAARAVGNVLNKHFKDCVKSGRKTIPCYRVIRLDGSIGGYARGDKEKRKLLRREGTKKNQAD